MSKRIEMRGITKLNDCLLRSEYLLSDIKDNDKTPSWDGFIELYNNNNENKKKSDLLSRIPVQVKRHVVSDVSSDQIPFSIERAEVNIKIQGTLAQRINDTRFILALFKNKYFTVGGEKPHDFRLGPSQDTFDFNKEIKYNQEYLDFLLEFEKTLALVNVKDEVDFNGLSGKDKEKIEILISSILYKEPQDLTFDKEIKENAFRRNIKINNILIALLFIRRNDGKYLVSDFFANKLSASFQSQKDGKFYNASIFLSLTKNDLLTISNINFDIIYVSFIGLEPNEELFGITNQFILNMIDAYDTSKNKLFLETALKILDWLIENDHINNRLIYTLNKLQIIKRTKKLTDVEISQLHTITENNKANDILTGAHLLLGNLELASYHFDKMPEKNQNDFNKYPISIFWKKEEGNSYAQ